jgi:hypothetical protein
MLTRYRFGFHSVVRHGRSLFVPPDSALSSVTHQMHHAANRFILSPHVHLDPYSDPQR